MVTSKELFEQIGPVLRDVKVLGWDSMLTLRGPGDYEEGGDNLGNLMPRVEEGIYDLSSELIKQLVTQLVLTRGPGCPEVSDIFAAWLGTDLATMKSLFRGMERVENLEAKINGVNLVIPTYQSTQQLTDEARERADSGLFGGLGENGTAFYEVRNGKIVRRNLGGQDIEPALNDIDDAMSKDPFMRRYDPFMTRSYLYSRVWTKQGATEDELSALGEKVYNLAEKVAHGKFQWTQSVPNGRGYLFVSGLDKSKGMEFAFKISGKPFSYGRFGYGADGVLGRSEKGTVIRPDGSVAAVALDVVKSVNPLEAYVQAVGNGVMQFKDPLGIYPDIAYVPAILGQQPAYIAVSNPLAAMFLIREVHRIQSL